MTALQVIIKEAKAIRKKMPKMEWKKAVAQASAIYASKHKGTSLVGKKKVVKKAAKKKTGKKVGVIKKKAVKKTATKRKPTEKAVLKSIKRAVSVQKAHMSLSGNQNINLIKDIEYTKNLIKEQAEILIRLQNHYKKTKSKIDKELTMMDIKTLKNNFIPHNKKHLRSMQILLKKAY